MSIIKNAIFGVCSLGSSIKDVLQNSGLTVDFFVDNDVDKQTQYEGLRVIAPEKLADLDSENKINVYIAANKVEEIVLQLKQNGFKGKVYGIKKSGFNAPSSISEFTYEIDIYKPRFSYIEYEVARHCNLKCKGCTHFSDLEKQQTFGDVDIFKADIERLKELFWGIRIIRLLGGEPLLNPEFPKFYRIARETFQDAKIQVVSNGLLIPRIEEEILDEMRGLQIEFDITQYVPTSKVVDQIRDKLDQKNVRYHISTLVETFFDRNNFKGNSNIKESFAGCTSKGCHFLYNGRLAVCPRPFTFKRVKDEYGIDDNILERDIIDIYGDDINGEYLNKRMDVPAETCRYCLPQRQLKYFKWKSYVG